MKRIVFVLAILLQGCQPLVWTCYRSTQEGCVQIDCNNLTCGEGERALKYYPEKTLTLYTPTNMGKCFKMDGVK